MIEIWKDIEGYEGFYMASYCGKIKSLDRFVNGNGGSKQFKKGKILKPFLTRKGYPMVDMKINGVGRHISVHILIAKTYVPNPENKPQVNHKDGIKINTAAWNLEWNTNEENMAHAIANGLRPIIPLGGYASKLTEDQVRKIRALKNTFSQKELSKMFNTCQSNIGMINTNKTWLHI